VSTTHVRFLKIFVDARMFSGSRHFPAMDARRSKSVQWLAVVAGAGVAALAVLVVGLVLLVARTSKPTLERVALYRNRAGVRVCASQPLHNCTVLLGTAQRRDRILGPIPAIDPPVSCDDQETRAYAVCMPESEGLSGDPMVMQRRLRCMAAHGVIEGDLEGLSRLRDARESSEMNPHAIRVECAEGRVEGAFPGEGY
jgi:hypothetical protein